MNFKMDTKLLEVYIVVKALLATHMKTEFPQWEGKELSIIYCRDRDVSVNNIFFYKINAVFYLFFTIKMRCCKVRIVGFKSGGMAQY